MSSLTEEIIASRDWRARELETLKRFCIVKFKSDSDAIKEQYFRMCVPYIYAHWEGFIVESFKLLMDFLNNQKLSYQDVTIELDTFSQKESIKPLAGKQSFTQCVTFIKKFREGYISNFYITSGCFTTKSNLNFEQLCVIFSWFGLKNDSIIDYKTLINKLVYQRNRIAHGERGITISLNDINNFVLKLIELYDEITKLIDDYVSNRKYINQAC
ncbi:MAG: hypothetical protein LBR68_07245 [Lachnoclostridium sp.]|jgi:hypothetical protein|nr:hypothetical protein [Lachnoclostridium sp.]